MFSNEGVCIYRSWQGLTVGHGMRRHRGIFQISRYLWQCHWLFPFDRSNHDAGFPRCLPEACSAAEEVAPEQLKLKSPLLLFFFVIDSCFLSIPFLFFPSVPAIMLPTYPPKCPLACLPAYLLFERHCLTILRVFYSQPKHSLAQSHSHFFQCNCYYCQQVVTR